MHAFWWRDSLTSGPYAVVVARWSCGLSASPLISSLIHASKDGKAGLQCPGSRENVGGEDDIRVAWLVRVLSV